jgi:hypothetical protein
MFRWSCPQPIPPPLATLLEEAGCVRCSLGETAELTVFLPPHLLVSAGLEPGDDLAEAYAGLNSTAHHGRLVNGERLLGLRPAELAHWLTSKTMQRPWALSTVDPLLAAVTLTLLEHLPKLEQRYQQLDAESLRGGAPVDHDYRQRLQPSHSALLAAWNGLIEQQRAASAQGFQALARDLEQQVISTQEAKAQAAALQRSGRYLQGRLSHANQLLARQMILLSRTRQ